MVGEENIKEKEQFLLKQKLAKLGKAFAESSSINEATETEYLTKCNQLLHQYLLKIYKDDFVFCSFSYLNEYNEFGAVPYYFYSDCLHNEELGSDYWKTVSWDTNVPNNRLKVLSKCEGILGDNYANKKIGEIKELIWYLLNVQLKDEKILALTQLLLKFGIDDDRSFIMADCKSHEFKPEIRFLDFDLKKFDVEAIDSTIDFEKKKSYSTIPSDLLDSLRTKEFRYNSIEEPILTEEKIETLRKQLNIYKLIAKTQEEDFYFYFLKPITSYQQFRGVTLLCLNKKMDSSDIEFHENLNYRILSDAVVQRIRTFMEEEKQSVKTQLVFSVGHFLKHKTNKVPSLLENVKRNIKKVDISELEMRRLINRDLETAKLTSERIHKLALIIDIIAKSFDGRNYYLENDIENKTEYFTDSRINITELIKKVHAEDYESTIELKMDDCLEGLNLEIEPFLYNDHLSKHILPSHLFYEEIFTETFENCKQKAKQEIDKKRELTLTIETLSFSDAEPFKCLILTNKLLDKTQFDDLENLIPSIDLFNRIDKNIKKISGIVFLDTFLNVTKTGNLLFKRCSVGENYYFSIAFKLENLQIKEHDKYSTD